MGAVLIVAHGQPSDPGAAEAALADLAGRVAGHLPGWAVGSATLAAPGALAAAVARLGAGLRVFPMFMAGGWFTRVHLPGQLAKVGATGWQMLEPFGCLEAVQELAVQVVHETGAAEAIIAARVAARVAARGLRVETGFIDQGPQLATLTGFGAGAVCLPFFAAEGGHVQDDIPAALSTAGFQGRLLPALGLDPRVPGIIAEAVVQDRKVCDGACRWG